jgi:hypothetical protein
MQTVIKIEIKNFSGGRFVVLDVTNPLKLKFFNTTKLKKFQRRRDGS